jgi:hypothetical protein
MTIETRTAIEPQDVLGIEIECTNCQYRCVRSVGSFYDVKIACPNCNASWLPVQEEFGRLAKLANTLGILSKREQTAVKIRFEIACPQSKS